MTLRNRIVAAASARPAGENAFQRKPSALQRAMLPDSFYPVGGTGGRIAAHCRKPGGYELLVAPYDENEHLSDQTPQKIPACREKSFHRPCSKLKCPLYKPRIPR